MAMSRIPRSIPHSPEIEIVGVVEPDTNTSDSSRRAKYGFDPSMIFTDLENVAKAHPQAVLSTPTPTITAAWSKSAPVMAFT